MGRAEENRNHVAIAVLILCSWLVYLPGFSGVFVFDDAEHIVNNPALHSLWSSLWAPINATRPLVGASFALNYTLGGIAPFGYHVLNWIIHTLTAILGFTLVRFTLQNSRRTTRWSEQATPLAFAVALLWTVHPLNVQAVTYVTQRFQSLMGCFYLLTLLGAARAFAQPSQRRWTVATITACWCGALCKQDMVTAPLAVLAYQSLFFPRPSERGIKAQYSALYLGLFLVWPLLALLEHFGPHGSFAGFHHENVGSWVYLQTQFGVIVHYLGAALWPQRLSFDPGWKFTHNLSEVWWQMLVLVSLGVITLGAWMRGRPWAFLGLFFFLTLAPSSSVLPIADPAWNYRMYLPLWAVIATLAGAAPRGLLVYLSVALALPLGRITWQENKLYRSDLALWSATAERSPQNPRALNNFGIALERLGQIEAATAQYKAAHTLDAKYPGANLNLGRRAAKDKNFVEAIQYFRAALAADPTLAEAYNGIGAALFHSAHVAESIPNFQRALELGADDPAEVNFNLGTAYALTGNLNEAEGALRRALELHPGHAGAAGNLQNVLKLKDARRL